MRKRKVWQLVMTVTHTVFSGAFIYLALVGVETHGATVTTVLKLVLSALFAFLAGMYASDATVVERRKRNVE